ncbi:MAG TPA: zf-HC2 domain-containing protein [Longimicrobiaceae bacterium]
MTDETDVKPFGTDDWTDRLSEYLDDELDAPEKAALEEHLRFCLGCRSLLEQLRAVKVRADRLQDSEPPPEVWAEIARRIGAPGVTLDEVGDELAARRTRKTVHLPWLRVGAAAAAVLALGIGIGRMSKGTPELPPATVQAPAPGTALTSDAYRVAVAQHLDRTEALLTSFRAEAASGQVDAQVGAWADEMLSNTRLLLDSPAAADPKLKSLLEDLELVLAQVAALPRHNEHTEVDLARRALDESRVLPRMRTLVPAGSPLTQGES